MKLLVISDLHLCDVRCSREMEKHRLESLAEFIRSEGIDRVLNLGDTVSRKALLRPEFASEQEGFQVYLKWRSKFSIPFTECAIEREKEFFQKLFDRPLDECCKISSELSIITMQPQYGNDHDFSNEQLVFLENAIKNCSSRVLVIGTHVPYPGSCSREIQPGIFLTIPEKLRVMLENAPFKIVWCGGHFHWKMEEPRTFGSLTALYAGKFVFSNQDGYSYSRIINTDPFEIITRVYSF